MLGTATSKELGFSLLDFFPCGIFDMRRDRPIESKRIFDQTVTISPKLIGKRHSHMAARSDGLSEKTVGIRNIEM